jgi:hypothetical protein
MMQDNPISNKDQITNVISTEQKQIDDSNPVEEKNIQNADATIDAYIPTSEVCDTLNMSAPIRMLFDMNKNLKDIDRKVRGIDLFVMEQLGYKDMIELCRAFSAEQIDGIAAAITQISEGKALILGDMAGSGKGRMIAGVLRYAKMQGKKPIFITERPNLYSDIYRDMIAIGLDAGIPIKFRSGEVEKTVEVSRELVISAMKEDIDNDDFDLEGFDGDLLFKKGNKELTEQAIDAYRAENFPDQVMKVYKYTTNKSYEEDIQGEKRFVPFIINGASSKTEIKDEDGNILYKGLPSVKLNEVLSSKTLGEEYDCVLATYSQFSSMRASKKVEFMMEVAKDNIVCMDESHNSSGASRRGSILQNIVEGTKGNLFASATYAKRADNMPIYSIKSNIADADLTSEELISALTKGGVAMQEIISSQLVAEGQMIRRERSYEGIEINYMTLDESAEVKEPDFNLKNAHYAIADRFLSVIRDIIKFVQKDVNPIVHAKRQGWIESECGVELANQILFGSRDEKDAARAVCQADLYNNNAYQGIFNIVNQLFFSINAEAVATWAVYRMKQGKKPIIALASTMESALDYAIEESTGSKIDVDFSVILKRRLANALSYTTISKEGVPEKNRLDIEELGGKAQLNYETIVESIDSLLTGITISPIDLIRKRIAEAGFTVEEVTGRTRIVEFDKSEESGYVKNRNIPNATDVFNNFNNNVIDCLIINQAGATGSSAHSIKTTKVNQVNYENGIPVVPTSLENTEEVKQRCMIILEAERDVNKEVQKRGRIFRTGMIFNPIYDYIISAIPSQKRLMMMLRKKLRSLDANTSSNQKQSNEILDVVDFLNEYGDEVVAKYLANNPEVNNMIGNPVSYETIINENGETENIPSGSIQELAHRATGRVAILSTEDQEKFYNEVTDMYKAYQSKLIQEGRWNLEVDSLDLQAKTIEKDAISVGNPKKKSLFGGATFLELCEINNIRKPFNKNYLRNLFAGILSTKDIKGNIVDVSIEEYVDMLHDAIDNRAKEEYNHFYPQYIKAKQREVDGLSKDKRFTKIKNESKRAEALRDETAHIIELWDEKISQLESVYKRAKEFKEVVSFFKPKTIVSYKVQKQNFDGIVIGVKMDSGKWLSSYGFSLKIAFPSSLRQVELSFASIQDIKRIMDSTDDVYDNRQREVLGKNLFNDWDDKIKDSISERVKRYIVTGNILKAYGIPELSSGQNKLISYSTIDKKVKKGILLEEGFNPYQLYVKIPVEAAKDIVGNALGTSKVLVFGDEDVIKIVPRANKLLLRREATKKKSYHIDKNNELNQYLDSRWTKWGDYYDADIVGKENTEKIIEILYSLGFPMNMYFEEFKTIAHRYDIQDRAREEDAVEEMIRKYNANLEEYEKEQNKPFELAAAADLKKMQEMEKELYELRKEKENNKAMRILVDTLNFAKKYKEKEMSKMEFGGEFGFGIKTIGDAQEDDSLQFISDSTEVKEILTHFDSKFSEVDELTNEPYSDSIGGLFVKYKDGDIVFVLAYEGSIPSIEKPVLEVYPTNKYFN